jgi:putative inorganic carbon (hco3(-)) transporter
LRDLILLVALLGIMPFMFRAPILGLLAWIWISLMNPQREVYGPLAGASLNIVVAIATILAWAATKERKTIPANPMIILLGLLLVWTGVTTYFALEHDHTLELFDRFAKTCVLVLFVAGMANSKSRIQAIIWAIAVSLAYFGVKGGAFVLVTGGSGRVYGPEASMIADNNHLGLALVTLFALLNYLRVTTQAKVVRLALMAVMAATLLAIIGTYSRGALLALGAMVAISAVRSRAGFLVLVAGVALVFIVPHIMPAAWFERMHTIGSADQDSSFMGRVEAWRTSFNIATQRVTGGGFASIEHQFVIDAFPTPGGLIHGRAAHSIYFQVLGDHGFIGLALYLGIIGSALLNTLFILQQTRARPDLRWANQLARMLQVSIVAYVIGGAALSMAYYDAWLVLLALTAALLHVVKQGEVPVPSIASDAPKWKVVDAEVPALPAPAAGRELR